jgi:hypothetical protein
VGAHAYINWLCKELRVYRPADVPALQFVALQVADDPYVAHAVFAVSGREIALLSPLLGSMPQGGLDTVSWNAFADRAAKLGIRSEAKAKSLVCALAAVRAVTVAGIGCERIQVSLVRAERHGWDFRVLSPWRTSATEYHISRNGHATLIDED